MQKRQAAAIVDKVQPYHCKAAADTPSGSHYNEQQQHAMIGSELPKKTRSPLDHKHVAGAHHTSASSKILCNNYKNNFDDVGLPPVKNFDVRNCEPASSPSPVPPVPPLRDASSLLAGRFISSVGHEKSPSWPTSDPFLLPFHSTTPCFTSPKSKSWSVEEQFQNGNYGRDRAPNKSRMSQLKTVVEKCEQSNVLDMLEPTKALDEEARSRERIYMPHVECERIFADDDDNAPCPPDRDISLAKSPHHLTSTFHQYNHSHQDSSYMSQDGDYAECYVDEGRTLLTKAELEQYTKDYDENIIKGSHQKQPSYAQSEGYHSYVSSNDSAIITPLIDRLRRENDVIVSVEENIVADRESSASSGSSSDTLKWHGSLSDVSVASGSYRSGGGSNNGSSSQHNVVHSARVQTPQRHHSESVLYLGAAVGVPQPTQQQWLEKVQKNNQLNSQMRKLFPVNTYSVYPQPVSPANPTGLMDSSPTSPKLSVAERIIELERQQLTQTHQQLTTKYTYLDPDKKHKVSDQNLKVIQKKALLSYYERHHSSWRSEPQLSPIPSPPQPPPPRPRLPTPTSRRSSSASDYQDSINKETTSSRKQESCNNVNDVTSGINSEFVCQNETRVHSQYSSSCGSLSIADVPTVIVGETIPVDDWVPELPPKKAHLRPAFTSRRLPSPDLPPPSPPPVVDDEVFISDEPLPPPPPEIVFSGTPAKSKDSTSGNGGRPQHPKSTSPRNTAPDLILSSTATIAARPGEMDDTTGCRNSIRGRIDASRVSKSGTNESKSGGCRVASKNQSGAKSRESEFLRYSQHVYKEDVSTAEYHNQNEQPELVTSHQRVKETYLRTAPVSGHESARTQNTDFLNKRSVFSNGYAEQQSSRYSSTQKLQINGKLAAGQSIAGVDVGRAAKYEQQQQAKAGFENKFRKMETSKSSQFSSTVLRHSEKFPPKLDPHCPPTTYQLSQSSYRREPRDREKGLPNFEGSYKRTMSPSPSCANLTNGYINGTNHCAKDVENMDPKSRTRSDHLPTVNGKYETSTAATRHYTNNSAPPAATPPTSQLSYRDCDAFVDDGSSRESPTTPSRDHASNTLPKNCVLNADVATVAATAVSASISVAEPKQRSSRAPRTQSDPSSVKDSSLSSSACSAATAAGLLSSQSSSSSLNLQKAGGADSPLSGTGGIPRSQSDLSNVGSTESGYSSLSLNVPSPSVSPTRLSSLSSSSTSSTTVAATSWSCAGIQCDIVNGATTASPRDERAVGGSCGARNVTASAGEDEDAAKYPQKSEIVLRINATTSDAASQTDSFVAVVALVEPAAGDADDAAAHGSLSRSRDRSTSPIFKQKSQEEIDCEELSRDLVSHLSSKDHLYRVLAPKPSVKKSTDYLENVFRPSAIAPFSEYSCSSVVRQSEDTRLQEGSIMNENISYQSETTICRSKQNEVCDNSQSAKPITIHQLQLKKEKLINRLDHRLNLLKAEQAAIVEECRINDALGDMISQKVVKCVSAHEAAKYKLHIQEIGHITSLLLGLSGRLAKVENSLQELTDDAGNEKSNLENKRDKLLCQLEEAKALKTNIDKRSGSVSAFLVKYFTDEEIAEYEYFVHMKSKLLIDCRDVAERIQLGEQQLDALKDAVSEDKF